MKKSLFAACIFIIFSCTSGKMNKSSNAMPYCFSAKIESMKTDPSQGEPLSIIQYLYKGKTVYYMASACCDNYNVVYDSSCNVLGYPDGGFTGKGDGNMLNFYADASDKKVIWEKQKQQ